MKKIIGYTFLLLIATFAFVFCYKCGSRGFFPLDQSIVYDGAWRIIQGQVPFKDFITPVGPVTFLYQAEIFCILGVSFSSYLIGAAVLNVLGVLLTFLTIRIFSKEKMFAPLLGAAITSVWFYAQMGTTYYDQTSMFFCLFALFCLLYTNHDTEPKRSFILLFVSGFIWTLAFLSKQNYAIVFLPLLYIAPFFMEAEKIGIPPSPAIFRTGKFWRKLLWITLGISFGSLIFALWLILFSDVNVFIKYFFMIPIEEGLRRFQGESISMKHVFHKEIVITSAIFAISALFIIFNYFKKHNTGADEKYKKGEDKFSRNNLLLGSVVVLYLIFYSFIMLKTTNNNSVNAWAFLGLFTGIGYTLIDKVINKKQLQIASAIIVLIIFVVLCHTGITSAWNRKINNFYDNASYSSFDQLETMKPLKWCNQTPVGSVGGKVVLLREVELKKLIDFLVKNDLKFFIFPDFTALYAFTGKPSPQPLLWFHKGLTYQREYDKNLDAMIVESLKKNNIETVIFEEVSWFNSYAIIEDFPLLKDYIKNDFKPIGYIGFYRLFLKKTDVPFSSRQEKKSEN